MNAFTQIDELVMPLPLEPRGYTIAPSKQSPRLLELTFARETVEAFVQAVAQWPVQALEYKSFLRFRLGEILDELCQGTLRPVLLNTILDRATGGMLITPLGLDDVSQAEDMVKFTTACAHLIGRSNYDAMSGQFYARFVVVNTDNSDSYLRQPHRVMELHNDGTFVNQITDYVLMLKIDEKNMEGGNSLLLHLDDWEQCEEFFRHPMARRDMRWTAPPSKKVAEDVFHSVFDTDAEGRPTMRYIDQFVQPENYEEGIWLNALSDSLEGSEKKVSVPVGVGSFLLINNLFWLHGRDRFTPHEGLRRELMRQRGYVAFPKPLYQRGQ
ncbi:protein CsiD [Pseudomonas putida]|uniref:Glutarate 2-hydroxylase n=1 Tax=Pseudomonas putida TaxID=303 RepID=A0AA37VNA1_PSEPU|nr:glutarate dioxygenase GlaH [Pseudomonas putida]GLO12319.1 protein CsiD [Pseudomonas putida]GLO35298.1 protein CsiD [Pseudomonas putida]HDS0963026.1 carbon starvation induced protein CsiD [Pseudomonas putida]HDS0990260.1 carbon starvation induced protein CsiD [Pseudomonas putida]